ncbi:hypothetical protein EW146_g80 [Bondarzewia mesenterica]|uniref:Peptidase S26 domain-containing protein n=1 Tax=Bondarzewia mesenterica TaxID=1095465 RepID=A0A4S4MA94_9AGAM|nr:hypothetical protein EW146_g80 [Bondarzewia mesenterica]
MPATPSPFQGHSKTGTVVDRRRPLPTVSTVSNVRTTAFMQRLAQRIKHYAASKLNKRPPAAAVAQRMGLGALYTINLACAFHLFAEYIGSVTSVHGPSMIPTMAEEGEIVIENRLSFRRDPSSLKRGDLVTLASPLTVGRVVCKRVLGLPGDVICVDPTSIKAPSTEHVIVPQGHIWIIGDNATLSRDSRDYGPVSLSLVRGTLFARVFPFHRFTIFRNPTTYID